MCCDLDKHTVDIGLLPLDRLNRYLIRVRRKTSNTCVRGSVICRMPLQKLSTVETDAEEVSEAVPESFQL